VQYQAISMADQMDASISADSIVLFDPWSMPTVQTFYPLAYRPTCLPYRQASAAKIATLMCISKTSPHLWLQFSIFPLVNNAALVGTVGSGCPESYLVAFGLSTRSWSDSDYGHTALEGDIECLRSVQSVIRVGRVAWPAWELHCTDELKSKTLF